ncbi:MAG: carbohydrate ABC transporter permease [Bacillota bacterium]|nr:carbohydrate ABC transporter permease [Bacillota bacterium]
MLGRKNGLMSATLAEKVFEAFNSGLMILIAIITLYPFWNSIIISFNESIDATRSPLYFWPRVFTFDNYAFILKSNKLHSAVINSTLRTVLGTLLHLMYTGIAAYGLSKRWLMGRRIYMLIFIFTMYFSGGLIPTYMLYRSLGLLDNFLVYIVPNMWGFFNAILFMAYYESIPDALEQAATIDGAGKFTIFFRIIFPASRPIFATIAVFTGVAQWNTWFDTITFTTSDSLITLQSLMTKMINEAEAQKIMAETMGESITRGLEIIKPVSVRIATLVITTFPITVVYPFLQKYFVKGIMIGSVKG